MNNQPSTWLSANIKPLLGLLVVVFSFAYFFACLVMAVKPDAQILIAVVGANGIVLGYWYGSSQGSSVKNDIIAAQNTPATPVDGNG